MVRTVNAKQAALRKAREKQLALDAERDSRDRRIEDATADVLVQLDERAAAEGALARINEGIGEQLAVDVDHGGVVRRGVGVDATDDHACAAGHPVVLSAWVSSPMRRTGQ
jgi:hypothetical protein